MRLGLPAGVGYASMVPLSIVHPDHPIKMPKGGHVVAGRWCVPVCSHVGGMDGVHSVGEGQSPRTW
eukprot:scaffold31840_cov140-Isochrysis_galbana.AAC.3